MPLLSTNEQHLLPLDGKRFELTVKKLADELNYGTDPSPYFGTGMDYAQSRLYVAGDPIRSMDWRVTARTGRYHVKEYEAPKRMPIWLLFDTSASMTLSSVPVSKYEQGLRVLTAIGLAAQQRMSPVGILGLGEREISMRPTLARSQLMQTAHRLRHYQTAEQTCFYDKITHWVPSLKNRAVVIVISDFHDTMTHEALKRIACQHDLMAIQLVDPAEKGLQGHSIFRAREAESGITFTATNAIFSETQTQLRQALHCMQVDHLRIEIEKPFVYALQHFLAKRNALAKAVR